MPYATRDAMVARFGEAEMIDRTDRAEPYTNGIVEPVLDQALASADAEVEAAVRGRYAVPLEPVPLLVVDIACALARAALWPTDAPEWVREAAKGARAQLDRIARGLMVLETRQVTAPAPGGGVAFDAGERVFTRESLGDW